MEDRYFVIRRYNSGTISLVTGEKDTDIIGLTTDEEYAKSRRSVFCDYEEVKMFKINKDFINTSKDMTGAELITKERNEQLEKHNITVEADAKFNSNPIGKNPDLFPLMAGVDALIGQNWNSIPEHWDYKKFEKAMEKPYKERLIIAGAMIAAEIDRVQYIEEKKANEEIEKNIVNHNPRLI